MTTPNKPNNIPSIPSQTVQAQATNETLNPTIVDSVDGKPRVRRQIARNDLDTLLGTVKTRKQQLDTLQAVFGTVQTPSGAWTSATATDKIEYVRKAIVVLSEMQEEQLKLLTYFVAKG